MFLIFLLIIVVVIFVVVYFSINIKKMISITIIFVVVYLLNLEFLSFSLFYFYSTLIVHLIIVVFSDIKSLKDFSMFSYKIIDNNLIILVSTRREHSRRYLIFFNQFIFNSVRFTRLDFSIFCLTSARLSKSFVKFIVSYF